MGMKPLRMKPLPLQTTPLVQQAGWFITRTPQSLTFRAPFTCNIGLLIGIKGSVFIEQVEYTAIRSDGMKESRNVERVLIVEQRIYCAQANNHELVPSWEALLKEASWF
jgi:hypothetical protein